MCVQLVTSAPPTLWHLTVTDDAVCVDSFPSCRSRRASSVTCKCSDLMFKVEQPSQHDAGHTAHGSRFDPPLMETHPLPKIFCQSGHLTEYHYRFSSLSPSSVTVYPNRLAASLHGRPHQKSWRARCQTSCLFSALSLLLLCLYRAEKYQFPSESHLSFPLSICVCVSV